MKELPAKLLRGRREREARKKHSKQCGELQKGVRRCLKEALTDNETEKNVERRSRLQERKTRCVPLRADQTLRITLHGPRAEVIARGERTQPGTFPIGNAARASQRA